MGVKTKLSKIEGVFFSLPAPVYEVTLFLYLLRPWRTGGKNTVNLFRILELVAATTQIGKTFIHFSTAIVIPNYLIFIFQK